jgi:hypothetical protein
MPVEPSANRVISFGFDCEVDLAQSLEGSFKERIDTEFIKTDKTPGTGPPTLSAHRVGAVHGDLPPMALALSQGS